MNFINLNCSKFEIPKLPNLYQKRSRIIKRFIGEKFITMFAPPGYGKTTTAAIWSSETKHHSIWLNLDKYDNNTCIFYRYFCMGLLSKQPENTLLYQIISNAEFEEKPIELTIKALSVAIDQEIKCDIIIDNFHNIDNKDILESLPFILKRLPADFMVIILGRKLKADLHLWDDFSVLNFDYQDWCFDKDEIHDYFVNQGFFITEKEVDSIYKSTGGWPIIMDYIAQEFHRKKGIVNIDGNIEILNDYIKVNFWDIFEEEFREFLLKTSVVEYFDDELCMILTGSNFKKYMQRLDKFGFFMEHKNGIFAYNTIFLSFLTNEFNKHNDLDIKFLCKSASKYYLDNGDYYKAVKSALTAQDINQLIICEQYFYRKGSKYFFDNEYAIFFINTLKDVLTDDFCDKYPFYYATNALYQYFVSDKDKFEYYIDKIIENFGIIENDFFKFRDVAIIILALDCRIESKGYSEIFSKKGNPKEFLDLFMALHNRFSFRNLRGFLKLNKSKKLNIEIDSNTTEFLNNYKMVDYIFSIGYEYENNNLTEALRMVIDIKSKLNFEENRAFKVALDVHQYIIFMEMFNEIDGKKILVEARHFINDREPYILSYIDAVESKMMLLKCEKEFAKEWLKNHFVSEFDQIFQNNLYEYLVTVRALIVVGDVYRAEYFLLRLEKICNDFSWLFYSIEIKILQSIARWANNDRKNARKILLDSLNETEEMGFVRIYADEAASLLPVIKSIINTKTDKSSYIMKVYHAVYEGSKHYKGISVYAELNIKKLSKMQKKIVEYLANGFKNNEIAEETGLSINTVKSHTALLYKKLNVNNAEDAVLKAKEYKII